jgi:hypothetical protein
MSFLFRSNSNRTWKAQQKSFSVRTGKKEDSMALQAPGVMMKAAVHRMHQHRQHQRLQNQQASGYLKTCFTFGSKPACVHQCTCCSLAAVVMDAVARILMLSIWLCHIVMQQACITARLVFQITQLLHL